MTESNERLHPVQNPNQADRITDVAERYLKDKGSKKGILLFRLHWRLHDEATRIPRSEEGGPPDNRHKVKREKKRGWRS